MRALNGRNCAIYNSRLLQYSSLHTVKSQKVVPRLNLYNGHTRFSQAKITPPPKNNDIFWRFIALSSIETVGVEQLPKMSVTDLVLTKRKQSGTLWGNRRTKVMLLVDPNGLCPKHSFRLIRKTTRHRLTNWVGHSTD